nr:dna repair protein rad5 [Quercus suber]
MADVHERPAKKRRFFVDDSPDKECPRDTSEQALFHHVDALPKTATSSKELEEAHEQDQKQVADARSEEAELAFDAETFRAVAGADVSDAAIGSLKRTFGQNLELAVNAYFDGSWKSVSPQKAIAWTKSDARPLPQLSYESSGDVTEKEEIAGEPPQPPTLVPALRSMPSRRYIGSMGVAGWATRSGTNIIRSNEVVKIERVKQPIPEKMGRGGKMKQQIRKTQDVLVRFTNNRNEEVGRLERGSAAWISGLIDQKVCSFEGHCIFAPDRIRTNDTIYLQLRCFLLKHAFESKSFIKPADNNRETSIFEAKETQDERDLRLRQIGLVKLFLETNLNPSQASEMTAKHKREGILQAAEVAEQYELKNKPSSAEDGSSSPSDEDQKQVADARSEEAELAFDAETFRAVAGADVSDAAIGSLKRTFGQNLELAVNAYFDGSWKSVSPQKAIAWTKSDARPLPQLSYESSGDVTEKEEIAGEPPQPPTLVPALRSMPSRRYIGSMGVAGWATRSGTNIIRSNEVVKIERVKQPIPEKMGRGGKMKQQIRKTQDVLVRFTNNRNEEVGRLERGSAAWISGLIDQKVCSFEGHCIFAPDRIRTNDTIYLQLRCFLLKHAFESKSFIKPADNNRETSIFEAKETQDERDLRLRQIGLVKLFLETNLNPSQASEMTAKHKREGILQAAEVAEQYELKNKPSSAEDGSSSPSDEVEEGEELEQDQLDSLYKKAQSFDFDTPEATPASSFVMDLRKYQKQALHWMLNKETRETNENKQQSMHPLWEEYAWPAKDAEDKDLPVVAGQQCFYVNPYSGELSLDFPVQEQTCLGGILADEMGLGKTIEMLSLIHSHPSPEQQAAAESAGIDSVNSLPRLSNTNSAVQRAPATTLVVAPMSLLAQWASEAAKASKEGTLKILVYYGSEKSANLQTLCNPANVASAPNLIITSYGVVLSEFNAVAAKGGDRGSHGGLFSLEYWRVILDEAHFVKNRQSKTAKACYELAGTHRWVLTGTPIVNRLSDLFSLVRFLRVEPWNNFSFWKTFIDTPFEQGEHVRALNVVQTVLEPLVLRRTKDMKTPNGEALVPLPPRTIEIERLKFSDPERDVYDYIIAKARRTLSRNMAAGTVMKSYTTIFAQILRLRQSCCHPILTKSSLLTADEDDAAADADMANGIADDMDLDTLIERFEADEGEQDASRFGANVLKQIRDDSAMECPICSEEPMEEQVVTSGCWHSACKKCLLDYIDHHVKKEELPRCFNCREPINARDVFEVVKHDDEDFVEEESNDGAAAAVLTEAMDVTGGDEDLYSNSQPPAGTGATTAPATHLSLRRINQLSSTKIAHLLTSLKRLRKTNPVAKSVVFSQFTSFLDLLGPALTTAKIRWLRFDGSMSQKERARVLQEFAATSRFTVLFLSLRAGGVGLNLTCAQACYMMDPWWSWAVEAQAIDRVHRMGQVSAVQVVRYVVEGSIEEKMLRVQERKKFIASSLGMMSDEEKKLQRIEDIQELLS